MWKGKFELHENHHKKKAPVEPGLTVKHAYSDLKTRERPIHFLRTKGELENAF